MYRLSRSFIVLYLALGAAAFLLATVLFWPWSAVGLLYLSYRWRRRERPATTLASGRTSTAEEAVEAGLVGSTTGLVVGVMSPRERRRWGYRKGMLFCSSAKAGCEAFRGKKNRMASHLVRLSTAIHTSTYAPTRSGKAVSVLLPTLMLDDGNSKIIVDYKGELSVHTVEHLRKLGYDCKVIDPYSSTGFKSNTYNSLDGIKKGDPYVAEKCRALAKMIVVRGKESDSYWNSAAEDLIAAMCMLTVHYGEGEYRTLQNVDALIVIPEHYERAILKMMEPDETGEMPMGGMLALLGGRLRCLKDKEKASVLSVAAKMMQAFRTPIMAANTFTTDFDPNELTKRKVAIFICPSFRFAEDLVPWLRVTLGSLINTVMDGGLQETRLVHVYVDEAAALGPEMDVLKHAISRGAGYGLRIHLFYQHMGQLEACWPNGEARGILSQTTMLLFATKDYYTAKYGADVIGCSTITTESGNSSRGWSSNEQAQNSSRGISGGTGTSWQERERPVLRPEEILALPERTGIVLGIPGLRYPLITNLVRTYEQPWMLKPPGCLVRSWQACSMLIEVTVTTCFVLMLAGALLVVAEERGLITRVKSFVMKGGDGYGTQRIDIRSDPKRTGSR